MHVKSYRLHGAMGNRRSDELGSISIEPIDGRCHIGVGGENIIHLLMVTHMDRTCWMDGTQLLIRNGCRSCQNMKRNAVSKYMGAHRKGMKNR